MKELNISDFEEHEYDLSSIDLNGYFLAVEEDVTYISGTDFFAEVGEFKQGETFVQDENGNKLSLTSEQSNIIFDILSN